MTPMTPSIAEKTPFDPATTNVSSHFSPAFKRLGWSNLFAQFSEQIALSAAALTAVLLLKAGPAETGWLQTAQTLPFLLLSVPAGLIADRASRRMLMAGSEALRAASLLMVLVLLAFGLLTLPLLAALGFVGAIGTVCYSVAAPALVPALVERSRWSDANRWLELARSAAFAAGPALGGALVAPALMRRLSFGTVVVIGPSVGLLAAGVMLATVWAPSAALTGLSFFLFGAGPILWTISTVTLRQAVTPDALLGRVSAFVMTATFGARPVGVAIGASIAAHFGASTCLVVATMGFAIQLVVICLSPVRTRRKAIEGQS